MSEEPLPVSIGDRVRVQGKTKEYTVVTMVGDFVGLVSDNYIPDPKASTVEIAVSRGQISHVTPASVGNMAATPVPQIETRNY